jgi:hypothetical protein
MGQTSRDRLAGERNRDWSIVRFGEWLPSCIAGHKS